MRGGISTREIIVIVPALLGLKRFGGFLNRGWGPISPVCDGTAPHRLVSLYHPPTRVGGRCEARTNQRFYPMELRFPHRGGRCRPERTRFSSPVCLFLDTYGMTPGPGSGPYRPRVELAQQYTNPVQLEIDRSVALGISTLCGEVSILVIYISVFVPGLSELYICGWIMILGMDPIVPRWRLLYVRSPANERPAIRPKGHTTYYMCIFSSKTRSSLQFLTTKLLAQCYRVLLIFHRPDESSVQQQVAASL